MRVAFGYFKKHFLMTDAETAARRQGIVDCAAAHGCKLAALFIDDIDTAPAELHNALTALMNRDDRVLIVPNLLHFASSGNPIEFRQSLQNHQIDVLLSEAPNQAGRVY
jgi:MoxR-like ATPase